MRRIQGSSSNLQDQQDQQDADEAQRYQQYQRDYQLFHEQALRRIQEGMNVAGEEKDAVGEDNRRGVEGKYGFVEEDDDDDDDEVLEEAKGNRAAIAQEVKQRNRVAQVQNRRNRRNRQPGRVGGRGPPLENRRVLPARRGRAQTYEMYTRQTNRAGPDLVRYQSAFNHRFNLNVNVDDAGGFDQSLRRMENAFRVQDADAKERSFRHYGRHLRGRRIDPQLKVNVWVRFQINGVDKDVPLSLEDYKWNDLGEEKWREQMEIMMRLLRDPQQAMRDGDPMARIIGSPDLGDYAEVPEVVLKGFIWYVRRADDPRGGCSKNPEVEEWMLKSRSIVVIQNNDAMPICASAAIVVANAYHVLTTLKGRHAKGENVVKDLTAAKKHYEKIRKGGRLYQRSAARKLCSASQVPFAEVVHFSMLKQFASYLGRDIVVVACAKKQNAAHWQSRMTHHIIFCTRVAQLASAQGMESEDNQQYYCPSGFEDASYASVVENLPDLLFLYYTFERNLRGEIIHEGVGHFDALITPMSLLVRQCPKCYVKYTKSHAVCNAKCSFCFTDFCGKSKKEGLSELHSFWVKEFMQIQAAYEEAPKTTDREGFFTDWCVAYDILPPITTTFDEMLLTCEDCQRVFPSLKCLEAHKTIPYSSRTGDSTTCHLFWACHDARCSHVKVFSTPEVNRTKGLYRRDHVCGETFFCKGCQSWCLPQHSCFLQPIEPQDPFPTVWYADFECFVRNDGYHEVNYAVVQRADWLDKEGAESSESHVFYDEKSFCEWVLQPDHYGHVFVFHNGRAYDFHFIRNYILKTASSKWDIQCLRRGMKLVTMTAAQKKVSRRVKNKITFCDSLNFLPFALATLAKTFELRDKGYFPHRFNNQENKEKNNYVLSTIPDEDCFFECHNPSFKRWHKYQREVVYGPQREPWVFWKEMDWYCSNDVTILRTVMEKFRHYLVDQCGVDPLRYPTLPAVTTAIFFSKFYRPKEAPMAIMSTEYTLWARKGMFGGRTNALKLKCVTRPCNVCEARMEHARIQAKTLETEYLTAPAQELGDICFPCFKSIMASGEESDPRLCFNCQHQCAPAVIENLTHYPRYVAFSSEDTCSCPRKIGYYDVTSLYPYVLAKFYYPIGSPRMIERFRDRPHAEWVASLVTDPPEGQLALIECYVVPPQHLYLPVLPSHGSSSAKNDPANEKKLLFHLYPQKGVWTSAELKKAVEKGYQIKHFKRVALWDPTQTSKDFFAPYILHFLKRKTLANGQKKILKQWLVNRPDLAALAKEPASVQWEHYCDAYNSYYEKLCGRPLARNEQLDPRERVEQNRNSVEYAMAKLKLNSLWGRFCMRNDFWEYELIKCVEGSVKRFYSVVNSPKYESKWDILTPDFVELKFRCKNAMERRTPNHTNVNVGIFTTSYARLVLYEAMEKTGKDTLYHDTDSIVFRYSCHSPPPLKLGDFLGEFTNELEDDEHIVEFYGSGPKNYAMVTNHGTNIIKCKGFNLKKPNVRSHVKLKTISDAITEATMLTPQDLQHTLPPLGVSQSVQIQYEPEKGTGVIQRDNSSRIHSASASKSWRVFYTKREIIPSPDPKDPYVDTIPWGYKFV